MSIKYPRTIALMETHTGRARMRHMLRVLACVWLLQDVLVDTRHCTAHDIAQGEAQAHLNEAAAGASPDEVFTLEEYTRLQYELFPYPPPHVTQAHALAAALGDFIDFELHPELTLVAPSHLLDLNHHVFGGRRDFCKPFRILVAGGGTGFRTFILASQLADMKAQHYEIVHVDLSAASIKAAQSRLESRKVLRSAPVRFIRGSILDIPHMDLGTFDYIDCLGVLHHMQEQEAGLRALAAVLKPGGGMGIMLYGEMGRRGVYEVRRILSMLEEVQGNTQKRFRTRIDRLRRLLNNLPPSNWLRLDPYRWKALQHFLTTNGEAGMVDLFMNPVDTPYNVSMVFDLAASAGMAVQTFIPPHAVDPRANIHDATLLQETLRLPRRGQLGLVELLVGHLDDLSFYLVKKKTTDAEDTEDADPDASPSRAAQVDGEAWDLIPVPVHFNVQLLLNQIEDHALNSTEGVPWTYNNLALRFPLHPFGPSILRLVDGRRTLRQIFEQLPVNELLSSSGVDVDKEVDTDVEEVFLERFRELLYAFQGMNRMYLSAFPISTASLNNVNNYYIRQSEQQTPHNMHNYLSFQECAP